MGRVKELTDRERVMRKVVVDAAGCWNWNGGKDRDGYAQMKVGSRANFSRKTVRVHRLMYQLDIGGIAAGLVLDHLCRNRSCVNPRHLEAVSPKVNTQRGERATATHCKSGHPLAGKNLYVGSDGRRGCKTCKHKWALEHGRRTGWAACKRYRERVSSA